MTNLLAQLETAPTPIDVPDVEWSLMWPLIVLSIGGVLLITITSLVPSTRGRGIPAGFTAALSITALAFLPWMSSRVNDSLDGRFYIVDRALVVDGFTIFVTAVICIALLLVSLILDDYLRREGLDGPEWYVLLLMSASGGILLASAEDLIVAFVGLEILSIAVYVLAALHLRRSDSQEAGFKYFVLGALSSAIFLYGIAMVYGATGSTNLTDIALNINRFGVAGVSPAQNSSLILVGMALLLVGFGFKVSAAPFQMWTPDVYEGAPTPVVAFMASAVKVAGFAGLVRVFVIGFGQMGGDWRPILAAMAVLTLLVGAFLAVVQTNIKRMLAYSSITHAGFMLIGVHAAGSTSEATALLGGQAVLFYMLAYSIMVIGTFGVVTVVGGRGDGDHAISSYRGLSRRSPVLAGCLALLLFAQSGVPFTSGFLAKFRVIAAAAEGGNYLLAGVAMIAAVIGAYLYLRVVVAMFLESSEEPEEAIEGDKGIGGDGAEEEDTDAVSAPPIVVPPAVLVAVGLAVFATIALGVAPDLVSGALRDGSGALSLLRP
ncbi:MAG: NADH-quinone oxidoreductase subunit N [Acidimicrobiales bacterium]|jgi:NADH-quinone oxidoreductase subunit N